ncbi:MAG: hypothetical protein AB7J30_19595, partial [Hyphomicrobium sp.]
MRIRLLTTAAAIALFAAMTAPGLAIAAGETPSSSTGATTGTSTSTGGSLSEPAGIDSNATTPSVYAPSSGAGSPGVGAGTAGTGVSSSGTLGNSTSPALSPSGVSTNASSSNISGSAGTMGSSGSTVMPTPGMPGTVSTPISGPVGSNAEPGRYIGAPYETSMGGTEHFRRTTRGDLQASNNQSRYDELVQTIRETAGDTRGMADRNTAGPLPQSPFA